MLEQFENETKHKYYIRKKAFSLSDISEEIKNRMSFYGIYMIKDRHDMEHIKVKKIKYQLRNANQRIIYQQERINELENKCATIRDLKIDINDRFKRLEKKML